MAAIDEPTTEDAIRAIKVTYERLPHPLVSDAEPAKGATRAGEGRLSLGAVDDMLDDQVPDEEIVAQIRQYGITEQPDEGALDELRADGASDALIDAIRATAVHPREAAETAGVEYRKAAALIVGDPDNAFAEAEVTSEGLYGAAVITHCCMESHGSISEWTDDKHLLTHMSTQNVSGIAGADGRAVEKFPLPIFAYTRIMSGEDSEASLRRTAGGFSRRNYRGKPAGSRFGSCWSATRN